MARFLSSRFARIARAKAKASSTGSSESTYSLSLRGLTVSCCLHQFARVSFCRRLCYVFFVSATYSLRSIDYTGANPRQLAL
ncbi:predicted protein [Arabidopsis lyrata subsp. lyrata]|uniref:Predicted protein n=1 Tax=Arabidopsis lyrata subsp. lyrata TaxID=81972 RepID=D7L4M4_ARALL|nr:predicted protein [Arabidopsis lyrata subsp. lyrata]